MRIPLKRQSPIHDIPSVSLRQIGVPLLSCLAAECNVACALRTALSVHKQLWNYVDHVAKAREQSHLLGNALRAAAGCDYMVYQMESFFCSKQKYYVYIAPSASFASAVQQFLFYIVTLFCLYTHTHPLYLWCLFFPFFFYHRKHLLVTLFNTLTLLLRFSIWLFCCVRLTTSTHDIDFKFSGVKECNKTRLRT